MGGYRQSRTRFDLGEQVTKRGLRCVRAVLDICEVSQSFGIDDAWVICMRKLHRPFVWWHDNLMHQDINARRLGDHGMVWPGVAAIDHG
jgi:hypothetical protein